MQYDVVEKSLRGWPRAPPGRQRFSRFTAHRDGGGAELAVPGHDLLEQLRPKAHVVATLLQRHPKHLAAFQVAAAYSAAAPSMFAGERMPDFRRAG